MQNVCRNCKYAKEKGWNSCYCVKYGIIIGYSKTNCVSHEYERGEDVEQVHEQENGD